MTSSTFSPLKSLFNYYFPLVKSYLITLFKVINHFSPYFLVLIWWSYLSTCSWYVFLTRMYALKECGPCLSCSWWEFQCSGRILGIWKVCNKYLGWTLSCNVDCCCGLVTKLCPTLWPYGLYPSRFLCLRDFPGKNTGVGCHLLLQGIFLTQGLNLSLLYWQSDSFPLSHLGSCS